jgi:succinate dehydrogenase / fumarate reductase cytochrome b subunit
MASATGTVRHPKGPAEPATGPDARATLAALLDSSVGAKVLVGLTGVGLVTFVIFHMIGNLKIFQGPDAINNYAYFLKHDLGALIWIARAGLLVLFVLHLALAIRLKVRSAAARPVAYAYPGSAQAGTASRTMIWTGVVILLFTLFHLAHYTFGWVSGVEVPDANGHLVWKNYLELPDAKGRHNVYEMMVAGFSNGYLAGLYLVAQVVLFVHLRHGIPSVFQTLGLKNARFRGPIDVLGLVLALLILVGNCAIVLAVQFGLVQSMYKTN